MYVSVRYRHIWFLPVTLNWAVYFPLIPGCCLRAVALLQSSFLHNCKAHPVNDGSWRPLLSLSGVYFWGAKKKKRVKVIPMSGKISENQRFLVKCMFEHSKDTSYNIGNSSDFYFYTSVKCANCNVQCTNLHQCANELHLIVALVCRTLKLCTRDGK